ncbi:fimbrial assembly protein [Rubrivivax gelatinosus]|uniref:pilus assembly PilX family protein n=1 Tax=Rubrivivax gelatinosus TaxID=28068 RepID=UPI0019042DF4|nr:pilus assembly PilX N-terminal domain-containing protein [Rubrivivax gelatinosus]MBK1614167.1 fimbrial assembly protein [Rubrivivax gelatinosus]
MKRCTPSLRASRQRGVAALAVVLMLFFVVSLVAAYTSRNLIFEQRTATNQYRSTQAMETAEAGLGWALTLLNAGRIDANCEPSAAASDTSFRERYLVTNADTGYISPHRDATSGNVAFASCVRDGESWSCRCPADGAALPVPPTSDGPHPAFRIAIVSEGSQPGQVRVYANGCTRLLEECLAFDADMIVPSPTDSVARAVAPSGEAVAAISTGAAMTGRVAAVERDGSKNVTAALPRDTLTVRGDIGLGGGSTLTAGRGNNDVGYAVRAGGTIVGVEAAGAAGTPDTTALRLANDPVLTALAAPDPAIAGMRMFASIFMMRPETFRDQPAAVLLDCASSACDGAALADAVARNPGRPIWVEGDLRLDGSGAIGSAAAPVLIVVTGELDFDSGGRTVNGLIYGRATTWRLSGLARVNGALVAENDLQIATDAGGAVYHDAEILKRLSTLTGSFVRVPGSWKDFP